MQRIGMLCLCLALVGSLAYGQEKLNLNLDQKVLESGKLQTFTCAYKVEGKGTKKRAVGVMLIDAPPAKVWEVLLNWDAMGAYVPGLEYYKTIQQLKPLAKDAIGESLIEGKLTFPVLAVKYTLHVAFDEQNLRQDWRLVTEEEVNACAKKGIKITRSTGGLKNIEGFEYIEPYGDGTKTVYYYAPIVETSIPVPDFAERFISKSTLPGYMEGVKKRVESHGTYKK